MTTTNEVSDLLGSINRQTTQLRLLLMRGQRGPGVLELANAIRRDLALCEVLAEFANSTKETTTDG